MRPSHGPSAQVTVLVVHDHELVHCGLRLVLAAQPWASRCLSAASAEQSAGLARRYEPRLLVVDLDRGRHHVLDVVAAVRAEWPPVRVLGLTGATPISPLAAHTLGVDGTVVRTLRARELARAIHDVANGATVHRPGRCGDEVRLSRREAQVLGLLTDGRTNREIAVVLEVSPDTVKQHAGTLYRKLGVRNRTEAARRGEELGVGLAVAA